VDDEQAVVAANRRYYDAFEAQDLDAMSDLWERSDRALCTHPGWATLEGWGAVAASYFALFQNGSQLQFVLTRESVTVVGDAAWVSVDENLLGDQGGVTVAAINLFVRRGDRWRMVGHHGSVVQPGAE
jgi:ketosteroid isomerase-like protein